MKSLLAVGALAVLMLAGVEQPASAYYDDVHYALNYYMARVIGFTPLQAHRLASLCVMVDYAPETEPTQFTSGGAALNKYGYFWAFGARLGAMLYDVLPRPFDPNNFIDRLPKALPELEELPADLERLLRKPEFHGAFAAQWRFHAFRDLDRFPNCKLTGPDVDLAVKAIKEQHQLLLQQSLKQKNPGIFLHFFQDETPHAGYCIGGGHWVLMPGVNLPIGASTDFLAQRSVQANLDLVHETAQYMLEFMNRASLKQQKPLVGTAEQVVERLRNAIDDLRRVNKSPPSLKSMTEVLYSKYIKMEFHDKGLRASDEDEAAYGKHADGPDPVAAMEALDAAIVRDGMHDKVVPRAPITMGLKAAQDSAGAEIVNPDDAVLYGTLLVHIVDSKLAYTPYQVQVAAWSVPTQDNEKPAITCLGADFVPGPKTFNGKVPIPLVNAPVGDLKLEVRYVNDKGKVLKSYRKIVRLDRRQLDVDITPSAGKYVLEKVDVDPRHRMGKPDETGDGRGNFTYNITETSYSTELLHKDTSGKLDSQESEQWTYQRPPTELIPGQEFTLSATGTVQSSTNKLANSSSGGYAGENIYVHVLQAGSASVSGENKPRIYQVKVASGYQALQIELTPFVAIYHYRWVNDKDEAAATAVPLLKPGGNAAGYRPTSGAASSVRAAGRAGKPSQPAARTTSSKPTSSAATRSGAPRPNGTTPAKGVEAASSKIMPSESAGSAAQKGAPKDSADDASSLQRADGVKGKPGGEGDVTVIPTGGSKKSKDAGPGNRPIAPTAEVDPTRGFSSEGWELKTTKADGSMDNNELFVAFETNGSGTADAWSRFPLSGDIRMDLHHRIEEWDAKQGGSIVVEYRIAASTLPNAPALVIRRRIENGSDVLEFGPVESPKSLGPSGQAIDFVLRRKGSKWTLWQYDPPKGWKIHGEQTLNAKSVRIGVMLRKTGPSPANVTVMLGPATGLVIDGL